MSYAEFDRNKLFALCNQAQSESEVVCEIKGANELTTFKGGGEACVFTPRTEREFLSVYGCLSRLGTEPYILGGGSDVILADGLCSVPVILTKRLDNVEICGDKVIAGCGAKVCDVMAKMRKCGLGGLEFMTGVPATVGGIVHMNASAFSAQTADYVSEIRLLSAVSDKNGKKDLQNAFVKSIDGNNINADDSYTGGHAAEYVISEVKTNSNDFGYRKGARGVILGATFDGIRMSESESLKRSSDYMAMRLKKQPRQPSCGSVFKNGSVPSGKLIDECGLRGVRCGGAQISELHGNFIVNTGGATAEDFITLVGLCEREVLAKFGVKLQREFVYLK